MKFRRNLIGMTLLLLLLMTATAGAAPNDAGRIVLGNPSAPVTIVEITDFQCPYCGAGAQTLSAMMKKYEGKVKMTVRHYPLPFHPAALPAALYFEGIAVQSPDKAWQFYDALFAEPEKLPAGEEHLKKVAAGLGVDMQKLDQDARSAATYQKIAADGQEFERAGLDGVPVFVINGTVLVGAQPPQKFAEVIDAALAK